MMRCRGPRCQAVIDVAFHQQLQVDGVFPALGAAAVYEMLAHVGHFGHVGMGCDHPPVGQAEAQVVNAVEGDQEVVEGHVGIIWV